MSDVRPDPDGRYHLVPQAIFPPGVDLLTGSAAGPLVDTGLQIDLDPFVSYDTEDPRGRDQVQRYKRVYLHPDTIRELAQVAGIPVRTETELDQIKQDYFDSGWRAGILHAEESARVGDDSKLADRVDRLLRALGDDPDADVAPAEELAADTGEGDITGTGDGGPRRRARSSV